MRLGSFCRVAKCSFGIVVLTLITSDIFSQTRMDYADYLYAEKDYFRAISEYKRTFYFSDDNNLKNNCLLNISRAYLKSSRFKSSIRYASKLLNREDVHTDRVTRANHVIGLSYYGLKVFPMAEDFFNKAASSDTSGFSLFYLALLDVEKSKYEDAHIKYHDIAQNHPDSEVARLSMQLSADVLKGHDVKRKNPFLAALMSALLPGSGQLYCQHAYDGLQSFLYVGAFAFATYAAYQYDRHCSDHYVHTAIAVSITGLFHIGNIIGAQRTARYYNLKQKENFLNRIRESVFSIDY